MKILRILHKKFCEFCPRGTSAGTTGLSTYPMVIGVNSLMIVTLSFDQNPKTNCDVMILYMFFRDPYNQGLELTNLSRLFHDAE